MIRRAHPTSFVAAFIAACGSGGSGFFAGSPDAASDVAIDSLEDAGTRADRTSGSETSTADAKPKGTTCRVGGSSCSTGTECCSNRCVDGACDPCAAAGSSCGKGATCCPNAAPALTCFQRQCSTCAPGGAACTSTADCCSRACTGGTCEAPPPCRATGSSCTTNADCCDLLECKSGTCACEASVLIGTSYPKIPKACIDYAFTSCCPKLAACLANADCEALFSCRWKCDPFDDDCRFACPLPSATALDLHIDVAQCTKDYGGNSCTR